MLSLSTPFWHSHSTVTTLFLCCVILAKNHTLLTNFLFEAVLLLQSQGGMIKHIHGYNSRCLSKLTCEHLSNVSFYCIHSSKNGFGFGKSHGILLCKKSNSHMVGFANVPELLNTHNHILLCNTGFFLLRQ